MRMGFDEWDGRVLDGFVVASEAHGGSLRRHIVKQMKARDDGDDSYKAYSGAK